MSSVIKLLGLLALFLQISDIITTKIALTRGCREVNPVTLSLFEKFGENWTYFLKVLLGMIIAGLAWIAGSSCIVLGVLLGLDVFYLLIVLNNLRNIGRAKCQ